MKIALAAYYPQTGMRGGDVYSAELAEGLARVDAANDYALFGYFFHRHAERAASIPCPDAPNFRRLIKRWPQGLVDRLDRGWGVPVVEAYLRLRGFDLYHCPGPLLPRLTRLRSLISVHDIISFSRPDLVPPAIGSAWRDCIREAVGRATMILASSTATRDDLVRFLRVPERKIRVIILGVNTRVFCPMPAAALEAARLRYRLPDDFVLCVGPYEHRRNWEGTIRAVARLRQRGRPLSVVFTGRLAEDASRRLDGAAEAAGMGSALAKVGYVPRSDLAALYNLARAFVYPSFYDGFNLPMLEAMACGTPVVVSSGAGALEEIAGGAACLVDPKDDASIASGIERVLEPSQREGFRERGLRRAGELTWEGVARSTLEAYREALSAPGQ
ncbi:MAG: glycosyltransferase family 4 protein [Elusimicrobia bacterium]|nr:glycosyltransferase family 4 protein [Elusimicrobiota bacterium]